MIDNETAIPWKRNERVCRPGPGDIEQIVVDSSWKKWPFSVNCLLVVAWINGTLARASPYCTPTV